MKINFIKKIFSNNPNDVSTSKLFCFADLVDIILLSLGSLFAILAGGIYQLLLLLYGRAAGVLVDYSRLKNNNFNISFLAQLHKSTESCRVNPNSNYSNFDGRLNETVKYYLIFGFVSILAHYILHVCWNTACERQIKRMRTRLYESILRQDMAFFDRSTPGELNSVLNKNIDTIKSAMSFKFGDFINQVARGLSCVVLSMVLAWKFSIVFVALVPVMSLSTMKMIEMIKKYTIEELKSYAQSDRISQEVLSSLRTVLAFGLEKKSIEKYTSDLEGGELMAKKKGLYAGIFSSISTGVFNLLFGVGVYYAIYLIETDCESYSPVNLIPSFFCLVFAGFAFSQALPFLADLAQSRAAAARVLEIIGTRSAIDVFGGPGKIPDAAELKGDIEFDNVVFGYPQRPDMEVLKGVGFRIPHGKTVALVGSSGGGKSTVMTLLERFYLPKSGKIRIDGHPIDELDLKWLRSQMAIVSQEPVLFSTTIKENIRLGRLDATDAEIIEAAKNANAHKFITKMANGYDTMVGERGSQLSGGQKQRIAIARALIRNPRILLLDEATSALDYESERVVQEALDKAKIGRTTIIVAHRLSTIKNADLILCLADGRVKETGTHEELIGRKGLYYDLVVAQSAQKDEDSNHTMDENQPIDVKLESEKSDESGDENSNTPVQTDKSKKRRKKRLRYERKLVKYHRPEALWLLAGTLGQLTNGIIFTVNAFLFCEIYDLFAMIDRDQQHQRSLEVTAILIGLAVVNMCAQTVYSYAFALCGCRLTKRLRVKMFESLLRQEVGFHDLDENKSSILATQLSASTNLCKGLTSDKISLLAQGFAGIGSALFICFFLSWKLTLVMIVFVPIAFVSGSMAGKVNTNTKINRKTRDEEAARMIIETVDNIKTVVTLNREEYFIDQFAKVYDAKFNRTLISFHIQAALYAISNALLFFIQPTALSFGFYLMKTDGLALPDLFRVYASVTFSSVTLGRVYSMMPDQKKNMSAARSVFRIIGRKSKIDSLSEKGLKPNSIEGNIRFKDVFFSYPNRPNVQVLNGFNLDCPMNKTNALVGSSGCGKSTTIALLLRYYDVDSGTIYLDGVDIRELNVRWLRSKIGLVSQEPVLFNTSVFENICFGDIERQKIEIKEVVECAMQSNIHNKIESLPDRYETMVGSKGSQLSGGEKQRVAIARALIRRPNILLLDEATSALDNASEQIVQEALDRAQVGRTCIVIAHRLSTIKNAHKITVVKEGRMVEEGTHSQLMSNHDLYYKLSSNVG